MDNSIWYLYDMAGVVQGYNGISRREAIELTSRHFQWISTDTSQSLDVSG